MSGRTYAQIKTATWTDDDFRALPAAAKTLYFAMISNPLLNGIGVGEWDRQEFIDYNPDMPGPVVDAALDSLIKHRYVVVDWERRKYAIRSYLRSNSHLLNNGKNAAGLVNAFRSTFSPLLRHQVLHELHRLRDEQPNLRGWEQVSTLFTDAKFDYKTAPVSTDGSTDVSGVRSGVVSPIRQSIPSTDGSGVGSGLIPKISISTQYSLLNTHVGSPESKGDAGAERPELEALCERLADAVEKNNFKRPLTNAPATRAARLLIDTDGYSVEQIEWMIDWATGHEFWYKNIRSMSKLREQFERLKADAKDEKAKATSSPGSRAAQPHWSLR